MLSSLLAADDAAAQRFEGKSTRDVIEALLSDVNQNISSTQQVIDNKNLIMAKYQEIEISFDDRYQQDINNQLTFLRQNARDLDATVQSEITDLVDCAGVEIIQNSNTIHAAACDLVPEYVELLMEFVASSRPKARGHQ